MSRNGFSFGADLRSGYLTAGARAFLRPGWMNPESFSQTSLPGVSFSLSLHPAALAELKLESEGLFNTASGKMPDFSAFHGKGSFYLPLLTTGRTLSFGPSITFETLTGSFPAFEDYVWTAGLKLAENGRPKGDGHHG